MLTSAVGGVQSFKMPWQENEFLIIIDQPADQLLNLPTKREDFALFYILEYDVIKNMMMITSFSIMQME